MHAVRSRHEPEALAEYLVVVDGLLCVGTAEWLEANTRSRIKSQGLLEEPSAAGLLVTANRAAAGDVTQLDRPWRKRISVLSAVNKVYDVSVGYLSPWS
jgi:hypothetical protein